MLVPLVPLPSLLVFGWILECHFFLDDFIHLYDLANYGYLRLALTPHGGHLLLTSNSAYLVLSRLFGLVPRWWFAVVLATHAVNVLLLFRLVQALTGRALLAGGLAMLWGMAPTNQASLSWFAVYGHVLVATFILWLLGDMARIEAAGRSPSAATQARWALLALGAATSFGVGLGISLALAAATPLLLPHVANRRTVAVVLAASAVGLVALYLGVRPIQAWLWAGHAAPFDPASGIVPQLLSGPWKFTGLTAASFADLVSYGVSSLVLGPLIAVVTNSVAVGPWQGADPTWFSRGVAGACLVLSAASLRRAAAGRKRVQAGLCLLIAACYAPVAIVSAVRVLSVGPVLARANFVLPWAWVVMQPRYQYAGQALLAASLGIALGSAMDRSPRLAHPLQWSLIGWLALASPLYWTARAALGMPWDPNWDPQKAMSTVHAVVEHSPVGGDAYVENRPFWTLEDIGFPGLAALFLVLNPDNMVDGRRVHFIERNHVVLDTLKAEGGRIAELLVGG